MKFTQLLNEKFDQGFKTRDGVYTELYTDPTTSDVKEITKKIKFGKIRGGLLPNKKMYIWDALNATHNQIETRLKKIFFSRFEYDIERNTLYYDGDLYYNGENIDTYLDKFISRLKKILGSNIKIVKY